jgi:hypothetical protein
VSSLVWLTHLPSNPLALLVTGLIVVSTGLFTLIKLVVKNWCRIVGSLVVAFSSDPARRQAALDLAKIGEKADAPPGQRRGRRWKDDGSSGRRSST